MAQVDGCQCNFKCDWRESIEVCVCDSMTVYWQPAGETVCHNHTFLLIVWRMQAALLHCSPWGRVATLGSRQCVCNQTWRELVPHKYWNVWSNTQVKFEEKNVKNKIKYYIITTNCSSKKILVQHHDRRADTMTIDLTRHCTICCWCRLFLWSFSSWRMFRHNIRQTGPAEHIWGLSKQSRHSNTKVVQKKPEGYS